jgi:hypothetical protein
MGSGWAGSPAAPWPTAREAKHTSAPAERLGSVNVAADLGAT